mgnify:CR=1 FL=1|jgi:ABC-type nitrate/sulfonate/bicarbonate transport system, permease component
MAKFIKTAVPFRRPALLRHYAVRLTAIAAFVCLWHLAVRANLLWPLQFGNLPGPVDVFREWLASLSQSHYYRDIGVSTLRVTAGIALGLAAAVPLALWIGISRWAHDALFTILEMFRPIPLIAYLPVAMLLFYTIEGSIVFITFIGAFFPILINAKDAASRVPAAWLHAAASLGCGRVKALWKVYLPAMLPEIFTGLSVGIAASWMGVITGEMMSGQSGIGYATWQAYHLLDYKQSLIGMFTIGALGYASSAIVRLAERRIVRWK